MRAVLFDFTGTLFWIEDARTAVTAALGEQFASVAPELVRFSAINGSDTPPELPEHVADVWARRDLSAAAHRAAHEALAQHAGLTAEQARVLYDRGIEPDAWHPYPDTVEALHTLREDGVPVALVSNIGWDPRPVLDAYGVADCFAALALSDELGIIKPDHRIFEHAIAALIADAPAGTRGTDTRPIAPQDCLMVGDNPVNDGAAAELGCTFALVPPDHDRAPDTLLRALGRTGNR